MTRKILVHDFFNIRGGGERLSLTLANHYGLDLLYGFKSDTTYPEAEFKTPHKALLSTQALKPLLPLAYMNARRYVQKNYDLRLFTGNFAPLAAPRKGRGGLNIQYINTPPRPLYDQFDFYFRRASLPKKAAILTLGAVYRQLYESSVAQMDVLISNSENIRRRVQHFLGVDSAVVYPPVDIERYTWQGQGDYYLSTARLTPLKRIDMIVEAFKRLPHKKLLIASGGTETEKLKQQAAGFENIQFLGWTDDAPLQTLMGQAIATLYIPQAEDFGISPVESMAAGKPVIGAAEGGMLETVVHGATGVLLPQGFGVDALVEAVEILTPEKSLSMRAACEEQAQKFSRETFINAMGHYL